MHTTIIKGRCSCLMFIKQPLSHRYIETLFERARHEVEQYRNEFHVKCSINIQFVGFNNEIANPVKLWFNKRDNIFYSEYSNNFLINPEDKVQKLFVRYFVCTNTDGTFKTYQDTLNELHKITSSYYDATMISNYLNGSKKIQNNVYCNKCHRSYYIDETNKIYSNLNNYRCECGGKLSYINNIEEIRSKYLNLSNDKTIYNKEFFKELNITDDDLKHFTNFINNKKRISRVVLLPEIKNVINNEEYNLLGMYNLAFPKAYCITYHYIKKKYKLAMDKYCKPTMEYHKQTKRSSAFQDNIKSSSTISLNRMNFSCNDEMFHLLEEYNNDKHCVKTIKNVLAKAIDNNEKEIISALYNIDKVVMQKAKRYLHKYEKRYLDEWEKNHEYEHTIQNE